MIVEDVNSPDPAALGWAFGGIADSVSRHHALARDSRRETTRAGLDALSAEELACFTAFNTRHQGSFGFPFILAVKGAIAFCDLTESARIAKTRRNKELKQTCVYT